MQAAAASVHPHKPLPPGSSVPAPYLPLLQSSSAFTPCYRPPSPFRFPFSFSSTLALYSTSTVPVTNQTWPPDPRCFFPRPIDLSASSAEERRSLCVSSRCFSTGNDAPPGEGTPVPRCFAGRCEAALVSTLTTALGADYTRFPRPSSPRLVHRRLCESRASSVPAAATSTTQRL